MLQRQLAPLIANRLQRQPAVALLGPRQVGKTTLARQVAAGMPNAVFLDLELEADRARLARPDLFFARHRDRLVVLDEVQVKPDLFTQLRPEIDAERRAGRFLLLGSASGPLLRQSAESLAGRIAYLELTPFLVAELGAAVAGHPAAAASALWLRGGFPRSFLAADDADSLAWRSDFIATFLARDLPQLGVTIPAETLRRFWRMCAHLHGQLFNASQLGAALGGVAHTTVGRYLDLLVDALVLRRLPPYLINIGKRLVKAPKVYVRDSGILHALLNLRSLDDLGGHPVAGLSWEGFVIEQILATLPPLTTAGFYRTSAGAELDLVVEQAGRRIGFEVKLSTAPTVSRGFWNACEDLGVSRAYVVAPVLEPYPLADNVEVISPLMLGQLGSG
ncbi:MAG: ATP-binding protein [Sulfuritalea sp.]|jgi:predicted AAA+ superfamily ATPase|nr:ATP-binding protein [Sulfuritalea sp.]